MTQQLSIAADFFNKEIVSAQEFIGGYVDILNDQNYRSLKSIALKVGDKETKQIAFMILFEHFNGCFDITPETIKNIVYMVFENYPDISLNDITFFAKKVKYAQLPSSHKAFKYDVPFMSLLFQQYYDNRGYELEQLRGAYVEQDSEPERTQKRLETILAVNKQLENIYVDALTFRTTIYKDLETYCIENNIQESLFYSAYHELYNEFEQTETKIDLQDFVESLKSRFVVFQNSVITKKNINQSFYLNELIELINDYDILTIEAKVKSLGLWMIPTPHYFAAKKIVHEGGKIVFRNSILSSTVKTLNSFVVTIINDKSISSKRLLFILSYIFNISVKQTEHDISGKSN